MPNASVGRWEMVGWVISPRARWWTCHIGHAQVPDNHNMIVNVEQGTSIIKY